MKNKLHSFISILLTLIFVVGLMPLTSIPVAAKSSIPVVLSTANGDTVEWSSKVGSNDGYWEITAENDDYKVCICSGVTDHEAGSYAWSDLQGDLCGLTVKSTDTSVAFTSCYEDCFVTVNGAVVNVKGGFKGDNNEYYAVDITYGTAAVTEWHVGDTINLGGKNFVHNDKDDLYSLGYDRDNTVPTPTFSNMYEQWFFEDVIYYNESDTCNILLTPPTGKTKNDKPIGFKIKSGDGTLASPYEFELVYAAAVTEWHVGDPINLGGKYYIDDDQGAPPSYGFDRDVIVPEPSYDTYSGQWWFNDVIAYNASGAYALYISLPTGKTASDVPTGFKVKSGDGTEASPYEFELVYAAASTVSFGKVTSADDITAENIGECTFADAKAWILDNWDALHEGVGETYVDFVYTEGGTLHYTYFWWDNSKTSWEQATPSTSVSIEELLTECFDKGEIVYLCGFEAAATAYAGYVPTANDDADALAAKVVKFNGYDWYLIEDNSTAADAGTVTLLAKDMSFGTSAFDENYMTIRYVNSTVRAALLNLTADGGSFAAVSGAIAATDLTDIELTGEKIWLLSADQVENLPSAVKALNSNWWIRTPGTNGPTGTKAKCVDTTGSIGESYVDNSLGVRPALQLDLSKVEFDSSTNTFTSTAPIEYPLWIGDTQVTSANAMDTTAHPTWSYAADTHTLTLNGYTNSGTARADIQSGVNNAAIYYDDNMSSPNPLTIQLAEGTTNSLTMTGDRVYGIYVFGSALTITGNGTLNIQSEEMAINDAWGVAITGGTVNAASSEYYGIGSVTIGADISSVTVTGKLGAIYDGSNEEQALKNAVAGTGWTDTAGTTGEADIAISTTGQNVSSYLKVQFPAVEPAPLPEGLWVGETEVTDTVTSGKGWSYDAETNTLTLNGYNYYGYGHKFSKTMNSGLYYKGTTPLNIVLEGRSWISLNDEWVSGSGYNYRSVGIYAEGGVKFSGTGYLSVGGSLGGIIGDATVDGCELYISADSNSKDGHAGVTNLTVNSGKVTVHGGDTLSGDTLSGGYVGGYAVETLTVNGGIVYVYGGNAYNSSSAVPQSAVKTLTVNGGVLYAKSGYSSYGSYSIPAVAATADGGSITVGKDVKVYGADIQSSYDYDMPTTETEKTNGDYARNPYMIFEGPSAKVTVPYKDHEWKDGALVTTDKEMTCSTVTFAMGTEWSGNYYADHNVTLGSEKEPVTITLKGNTNIVLSDTAMLYVYGTVDCGDYTLNIYGNEQGHGGYSKAMYETGRFTINNTSENVLSLGGDTINVHGGTVTVQCSGKYDDTPVVLEVENLSVYAGSLEVRSSGEKGLSAVACDNTNVYGGGLYVQGGNGKDDAHGGAGFFGALTVYGGYVNAYGGDVYGEGTGNGGSGMSGDVTVYGGQISVSGGYSSGGVGGVGFAGTLTVYGGIFDADGGYDSNDNRNYAISGTVTLGEGVGYFEGKTLFAEGPEEEMESGTAGYAQIKGGVKYVYVDQTTGAVTTAYAYDAESRINSWLWSKWYIVEKDTTISDAVFFDTDEVNIIIADGATLTFEKGIAVPEGKTLNIYAQSADEATMGKLIATGTNGAAGIGGENGGNVYVYSGNVEATGDTGAAGIDGIVYIYGGSVTATGGEGSVGINGDLTLGEGITLYGGDEADPTTVVEEESGNYHRAQYMKTVSGPTAATITGTPTVAEDLEYTGSAQALITSDPTVNGGTVKYSTDLQNWYTRENFLATDAGTYSIYYYAEGDDAHDDSEVFGGLTFTVEIGAKEVTVTADDQSKTYGDADPALTYTASGLVGTDTLTGALARAEGENVGSYAITQGTLAGGDNYTITFTGAKLTVDKKKVTVTADSPIKKVGEADPLFTYTVSGLVAGDELTGSLERDAGEEVGVYAITQGTLAASANYELSFTEGSLTIVAADKIIVKVTATAQTKTYGDEDPELTYTVEGLAEGDSLTGKLARAEGENVGSYAITIGTLAASDKYVISFTGATLTVNKKEIKVTAAAAAKAYGEADPALTYTVEGLVGTDTLTGELERAEGENVGLYAIKVGTLSAGNNYVITFTGADFTIASKVVKITADDVRKAVGTEDPVLTYTVEGLAEGDSLTGELAREAGEEAGTYAITIGTLTAGDKYAISFTGATFTIFETHIDTDVKVDEGAPEMNVEGINEEVANSLLTEEEKEALENGEEVKIYLEVIAVDEEIVPSDDKAEIEKEAEKSGMKVGMYLDLSLLKQVGSSGAVAIHDTEGNMVKVTVTVPEELRNTNPNIKRTFYVVRVHDGKTDILGESTGDTVSFETDKFSTYSLTYKDEKEAKSASLTWLWIVLAVIAVAAAGAAVFFIIKKKNGGNTPSDNTDKPEEPKEPEKTEE